MIVDPELTDIQRQANELAVAVFRRWSDADASVFRSAYQESVLMVPSLMAEASMRVNAVERCKLLESVRMMAARVGTQNEIGRQANLIDSQDAISDAETMNEISHRLRKHIVRIRNEYSDRRGKNP